MAYHITKGSTKNSTEFPQLYNNFLHKLQECVIVCLACSKRCSEEGHKKTAALCAECAEICVLALKASSGGFAFEHEIAALCANACTQCAEECRKMQVTHCQECADICASCAKECMTPYSSLS